MGVSAKTITPATISSVPIAFGAAWLGLHAFGSRGREFPLTEFETPEVEYELSPVGELLEQADVVAIVEQLGAASTKPASEELVLDDVLAAVENDSRVVQ